MADSKCAGCGRSFAGERGLRAHQTARFGAMGCKRVEPTAAQLLSMVLSLGITETEARKMWHAKGLTNGGPP